MWTILKVFIEFVTLLLLFYALVFWPRGMWGLGSLTRDRTHNPCIGRHSLNHWTAREVPGHWLFNLIFPFSSVSEAWGTSSHKERKTPTEFQSISKNLVQFQPPRKPEGSHPTWTAKERTSCYEHTWESQKRSNKRSSGPPNLDKRRPSPAFHHVIGNLHNTSRGRFKDSF